MDGMNPLLATQAFSRTPINWAGMGNFAQQANYSQMPVGMAMMLSGQQNFTPQMQGAYDQLGSIMGGNADRIRQLNDANRQDTMVREGRHDSNQKWTMLYDALLKPRQGQVFDPRGNRYVDSESSPLLDMIKSLSGGGMQQGFGVAGAGGFAPNGAQIPAPYQFNV